MMQKFGKKQLVRDVRYTTEKQKKHLLRSMKYSIIIALISMMSPIYAKIIKLDNDAKAFDADYRSVPQKFERGVLLIVTDFKIPLNETKLIKPLREKINRRYWSTLTIAVNDENIAARLKAAYEYLNAQKRIGLLSIGKSYQKTIKYLIEEKPKNIQSVILLNPFTIDFKKNTALFVGWESTKLPLCVIYRQQAYPNELKTVKHLVEGIHFKGEQPFRAVKLLAGHHGSFIYTQQISQHIINWLHTTTNVE